VRSLVISCAIIAAVVSSWLIFVNYADKNIHRLIDDIENGLMVSVYAEDWEKASEQIDRLSEQWHDHKKVYTFFFNTSEILDTDYAIARAEHYIKSEDAALSAGELNAVREQLKFLHLNELITLDNIF
jgi:hypothetical protein